MTDYIDRNALLRDIEHYSVSDGKMQHWVQVQPAANVAPIIYAHWDNCSYKCSNCGNIPYTDCGSNPTVFGYKYCPYCGAMMKGE